MSHNLFNTLQSFDLGNGKSGKFYSLPALEAAGVGPISRLPVSIRLVLESVLQIFIYPFVYVVMTVLYYDLRVRKEGFDLELLASALQPA